jgi:hypothetical protein
LSETAWRWRKACGLNREIAFFTLDLWPRLKVEHVIPASVTLQPAIARKPVRCSAIER